MSRAPVELVVAVFQKERTAEDAAKKLSKADWEGKTTLINVAVVRRDENGKLHIKEAEDADFRQGAVLGGAFGGLLGLVAGPPGLVVGAAAGAVTGGVTAKAFDAGIPDSDLKELGEALSPGASAIVAVVEHNRVAAIEKRLVAAGAEVKKQALKEEVAQRLKEEK